MKGNSITDEEKKYVKKHYLMGDSAATIAEAVGRTKHTIHQMIYNLKKEDPEFAALVKKAEDFIAGKIKPVVEKSDPEVVTKVETLVETRDMTPREMIKRLYDLGYRIEDNQLVCYVKQVVRINDIITATV